MLLHQTVIGLEAKRQMELFDDFDLAAYEEYLAGRLADFEYPEAEIRKALEGLAALQPA